MKKNPETGRVCIIGAGPAGLAAADELSRNGVTVDLFEALSTPGGISRTEVYKDYRADLGGHRFFTRNRMLYDLWVEILGDDFLLRPRLSRILYRDRFYDYPLRIRNVLSNMGVQEAALCTLSYLKARAFPNREIETFEDWVTARFGERLFRTFFKTYTEKVWGIPCSRISADWAAQRIRNLSLREAVKNAILAQAGMGGNNSVTSLIGQFHYPRLGPGMMWEALAEKIEKRNSSIHYAARVVKLKHRDKKVFAATVDNGIDKEEIPLASCISSMPLKELISALDPPAPMSVQEAAKKLGYRDYIAVNLVIDKDDLFPDNWIYVHDPIVELGRIQNYKNWSPDMVPVKGKSVLGLEYFHFETDPEWNWPDSRLIERGVTELRKLKMIDGPAVEDGWVTRVPKAYPMYDKNYREAVEEMRDYLGRFSNLQTIGRNGTHRYNNMDHSMLSGIYAASNILGGEVDLWKINTEAEYHEEADDSLEKAVELVSKEIDPVAAGVASAVTLSLIFFILTLYTLHFTDEYAVRFISLLANYFYGYSVSWQGALLITLQSGLGGFIGGAGVAWLRNLMVRLLVT